MKIQKALFLVISASLLIGKFSANAIETAKTASAHSNTETKTETSSNEIFNAESKVYKIKGMHCEMCIQSIKEQVCNKNNFEKCDVQVGQVSIVPRPGQKINDTEISKAVKKAGHYRVSSVEKLTAKTMNSSEKMDPENCPEMKGEKAGSCQMMKDKN